MLNFVGYLEILCTVVLNQYMEGYGGTELESKSKIHNMTVHWIMVGHHFNWWIDKAMQRM